MQRQGSFLRRNTPARRSRRVGTRRRPAHTTAARSRAAASAPAQLAADIAQRPAGLGRGGGEVAVAGAGLGRAPVPHRQEPVPAQAAALSRPGQEHRAIAKTKAAPVGDVGASIFLRTLFMLVRLAQLTSFNGAGRGGLGEGTQVNCLSRMIIRRVSR
jgi:hypothetical protein